MQMTRVLIALLLSVPAFAWSQIPLKVGIPTGQDPHIIILNDQIMGAEGLSLDRSLRSAGFSPSYQHFPSLRAIERIRRGFIDAVINVKEESLPSAFKSSFSFKFHNCAVTKASTKQGLKHVQDFQNQDVVAFKNANTSLAADRIAEIARVARSYREIQDVDIRIKLLNAGRASVMLTEKAVFLHYLEKFQLGVPKDYSFYCLFRPTSYSLLFRSKEHHNYFEKHKK